MEKKLVSFNPDVMKKKVASVRLSLTEKAKERKNKALAGILSKGIELSKKQLSALESVRKHFG